MRYKEIIEHNPVPDQIFFPLPLKSKGQEVGRIGTAFGPHVVYNYDEGITRVYGIIDDNDQDISHIVLQRAPASLGNYWYVKNAYTDINYQQKGLAKELMLFALDAKGLHLLSDEEMPPSGMALWNSFTNASNRTKQILDVKTLEKFTIDDIGKLDTDGVTIISPENDIVDDDKLKDLRFFYLIEGYAVEKPKPGEYSRFGCPFYPDRRNLESMLTPYSHFSN